MKHEKMDVIKVYDRRGKGYVVSVYTLKAYRASRWIAPPFLFLSLHEGEWLTSRLAPVHAVKHAVTHCTCG